MDADLRRDKPFSYHAQRLSDVCLTKHTPDTLPIPADVHLDLMETERDLFGRKLAAMPTADSDEPSHAISLSHLTYIAGQAIILNTIDWS